MLRVPVADVRAAAAQQPGPAHHVRRRPPAIRGLTAGRLPGLANRQAVAGREAIERRRRREPAVGEDQAAARDRGLADVPAPLLHDIAGPGAAAAGPVSTARLRLEDPFDAGRRRVAVRSVARRVEHQRADRPRRVDAVDGDAAAALDHRREGDAGPIEEPGRLATSAVGDHGGRGAAQRAVADQLAVDAQRPDRIAVVQREEAGVDGRDRLPAPRRRQHGGAALAIAEREVGGQVDLRQVQAEQLHRDRRRRDSSSAGSVSVKCSTPGATARPAPRPGTVSCAAGAIASATTSVIEPDPGNEHAATVLLYGDDAGHDPDRTDDGGGDGSGAAAQAARLPHARPPLHVPRRARRRRRLPQVREPAARRRVQVPRRAERDLGAARGRAGPRHRRLLVGQPRPGRGPRRPAPRRAHDDRDAGRRAGDQARGHRRVRRPRRALRSGHRVARGDRRRTCCSRTAPR